MSAPHPAVVSDAAIRDRAYFLWEESGRPSGRDVEFWDRARVLIASAIEPVSKPAGRARAKASEAPAVAAHAAPKASKTGAAKPAKKGRTAVKV